MACYPNSGPVNVLNFTLSNLDLWVFMDESRLIASVQVKRRVRLSVTKSRLRWRVRYTVTRQPSCIYLLLVVSFRGYEILCRNFHLLICGLGLPSADTTLPQEMVERSYEVLTKVKVIMVHLRRHDQRAWAPTFVMKFLRVGVRNQVILHTMHQEGRAKNSSDLLYVVESL